MNLAAALGVRSLRHVAVVASNASQATFDRVVPAASSVFVISPSPEAEWHLNRVQARHLPALTLTAVNWQLKRFGPFDAIIDISDDAGLPHDRTWAKTFLHLNDGGVYVSVGSDQRKFVDRLVSLLRGEGEEWAEPAVEAVTFGGDVILLEKRGTHLLRLRHAEVDRLLPTRNVPATSTVLATTPEGWHRSRAEVHTHTSNRPVEGIDPVMRYPRHTMRRYTGSLAMASHSILYTEGTLMPETHRHHLAKPLTHEYVHADTPQFGRLNDDAIPDDYLAGSFYHLDSPFPGHFGHVLTETVARLWGWDVAKKQDPDLKAIWRIRYPNERDPSLERTLFGAYGIAEEDMVCVDHPVWLDSMVGVTPMWHNHSPYYVHPEIEETWRRIAAGLAVDPGFSARKIFVSRNSRLARNCRNAFEVEELFKAHGFTIVFPETMSLQRQAGLFRQAEVVAGFGGSAMFNVLFANNLRNLIVLTHEAYTARNEFLFASVLGGRLDYFWSTPDVQHPDDGWTQEAFTSDWAFDFARNERALTKLLSSLD
jgi:capsular polysaccharide biosynthesis protein